MSIDKLKPDVINTRLGHTINARLHICDLCLTAQAPQRENRDRCGYCDHPVSIKTHFSLERTWVYLLTGMLLYIPANLWPIMNTTQLSTETPNTIVGGVLSLWEHGSYPIAIIIFVASVIVPIAKFTVLIGLCVIEQFNIVHNQKTRMKWYRMTEIIGRWSMIDVFAVAFLAAMVQMGNLMSVTPGPAILAFGGMVVATMLAAESFDSRVIWQKDDKQSMSNQ